MQSKDSLDESINQNILRPQQTLNFDLKKLLTAAKKRYAKEKSKKSFSDVKIEQSEDMTNENQPENLAEQHLSLMLRYFAHFLVLDHFFVLPILLIK